MIALILSILVELGLIHEDFKHHRAIAKKEKNDGKKRLFQKYFLQPSSIITIITISILIVGGICALLFLGYQKASVLPKQTEKEIAEMAVRMQQWYNKFGKYPANLNELIGNSPVNQKWKNDSWNRPYLYSVTDKGFLIISAGADGKFKTDDDITSE